MTFELYQEVALARDLPEEGLCRGDVVTVVERLPAAAEEEEGYVLEVFNAVGDTIKVVVVPASAIAPLTANHIPSVRGLARTG